MCEELLLEIDESFVSKILNKTTEDIDQDVAIVKSWLKTQPHLPELMDDDRIRNFILSNKCSIEKTKQRIDMYYTIRSLVPELFEHSNPKLPNIVETMEISYFCPLPKLTKEGYRVVAWKLRNKQIAHSIQPLYASCTFFNVQEIRLKEDCMLGDVLLIDLDGLPIEFVLRATPTIIINSFKIYEKVYSIPVKGLYFINSPSYFNPIIKILKSVMKPKIFDRVHVFDKGAEVLKDYIDKEDLPSDFGGEQKSLDEIYESYKVKLKKYQARFDELDSLRVNESLRPEPLKNDEILGYYGNFKQLNVD